MIKILFRLLIMFMAFAVRLNASTYYVATDGLDSNDGTINNPWKKVRYAIFKLQAGDTLNIRGGVYFESSLNLGKKGTDSEPIVIQSYPGEQAEIDGGIPDFRDAPNDLWELVDAGINLYRSKQTYPRRSYMNAWLLDDDLHIVEYYVKDNLISTNYGPIYGFDPIYVGPGILHDSDGYLYIRLENNPNDLIDRDGMTMDPVPADINPNNHRISVFFSETLFYASNAYYVKFIKITFSHAEKLFDVERKTNNIEFESCSFNYGRYGLVLREGGAMDYEFHHCEFNNGTPDYVYWCDVKNRETEVHEAYSEFQSAALQGDMPGFYIHDNLFRDSFDALYIKENSANIKIVNNHFIRLRDDAMTFRIAGNAEVAYNVMWHVGAGVSCDFDNNNIGNSGHIYVHHNVIDVSIHQHGGREGNYRDDRWPVWQTISAFASHGDTYPAWWKVYNNTIVIRQSGYKWHPAGLPTKIAGNDELYVYNNIFYVYDHRIVFRTDHASSGSHYDGDVIYRANPENPRKYTLFYDFGNGKNYLTLDEFRANSGTNWEKNGLEVDPGFDLSKIQNPFYNPDAMWERYLPSNPQVFTPGASYAGLNWPGVEGVNYRGASNESATGVQNSFASDNVPAVYILKQNHPNPFNPATTISFSLAKSGQTTLKIYDILGNNVLTVFRKKMQAGQHDIMFFADKMTSGVYFYVLTSGEFAAVKKMILIK